MVVKDGNHLPSNAFSAGLGGVEISAALMILLETGFIAK